MKRFLIVLTLIFMSTAALGQQTTGPVVNTASVVVEADSDADNDGKIIFKTKATERVVFSNGGKVGIGTDSPIGIIDVNTLPAEGAIDVLRMPIQDGHTAAGSIYGFRFTSVPQQFGSDPRHDNVFFMGYNPDLQTAGEPVLGWAMENRYVTSQGRMQSEFYTVTGFPTSLSRPIAIDLYHDDGSTQVTLNTPSIYIANAPQTNLWMHFTSTNTSGDMTLFGNSGITYSGSREYILSRYGLGLIGSTSPFEFNLFGGGLTGETVRFFKDSSTGGNVPLTIKMGQEGHALRVGANGNHWQITGDYSGYADILTANEVDDAATPSTLVRRDANGGVDALNIKINHITIVNQQCGFIQNSNLSAADTARALNQLLGCLRDKNALIAPDSGP